MEEYFQFLEHKKSLISADLDSQIISYQMRRVDRVILIDIIEYAFLCNDDIGDEFHYILHGNILILVNNY